MILMIISDWMQIDQVHVSMVINVRMRSGMVAKSRLKGVKHDNERADFAQRGLVVTFTGLLASQACQGTIIINRSVESKD